MTLQLQEPTHVDEPHDAKDYADVISRVVAEQKAVIVRRDGTDLAAIVPLEYLEAMQEALAMEQAQKLLKNMDWDRLVKKYPPPQSYFEGDEPKPF